MICCERCFQDDNISAVIRNLNHKGQCPICGEQDVYLYNSDIDAEQSELNEMLSQILSLYSPKDDWNQAYDECTFRTIEENLCFEWSIFRVNTSGIRVIIEAIIYNSPEIDGRILEQPCAIKEVHDIEYLRRYCFLNEYTWDDFKISLQEKNRFFSPAIMVNEVVFREILDNTAEVIPQGDWFYRARFAEDEHSPRPIEEMYAPPSYLATAGRANSFGERCLYIGSDGQTCVKEIRAAAFDCVTIGKFYLKRNARVLDLNSIAYNSPFEADIDMLQYKVNVHFLKQIAEEIAKPMRKDDSELNYLPTQYISSFAKYLNYDGVKYKSTFNQEAFNVAFFDPDICECKSCQTYQVGNLDYQLNNVEF